MMFRAPVLNAAALRRTPPNTPALGQLLARLLLASLAASACTKEAPREPPPPAEEPQAAPAPEPSAPPPPTSVAPEAAGEQRLREDESGAPEFGDGASQAAPAKPATPSSRPSSRPAAKGRARPDAPRKSAPSDNAAAGREKDDDASPESLRRELSKAVDLSTPDCPSARERKQAICDLASQLCQLVERDPDVASVESFCADARQRCTEAQRRTAERCPR
jgi:hypothetical protein